MAVMREIRTRIKSVANTQQITKAMKMVAASKLRRVASMTPALRDYSAQITQTLADLIYYEESLDNIYINEREIKKVLYILVVGDMGLCGMYNTAVTMYMKKILDQEERDCEVWVIGKWGTDVIRNLGVDYTERLETISDVPTAEECKGLTDMLCKKYLDCEYDEIHFVYESYKSAMVQEPVDFQFLPVIASFGQTKKLDFMQEASLVTPAPEEYGKKSEPILKEEDFVWKEPERIVEYFFEPDRKTVVDTLISEYMDNMIYSIMLEARSGEHSARMTAMTNATENTEKLMAKLQLMYNRARQEAITTEISEIVGGAAALKK